MTGFCTLLRPCCDLCRLKPKASVRDAPDDLATSACVSFASQTVSMALQELRFRDQAESVRILATASSRVQKSFHTAANSESLSGADSYEEFKDKDRRTSCRQAKSSLLSLTSRSDVAGTGDLKEGKAAAAKLTQKTCQLL